MFYPAFVGQQRNIKTTDPIFMRILQRLIFGQ